mmetsp:Transcript_95311/g.168838  ORF Transcript_95311/g.168838 Transcript_95311/m.168838 type:complete len:695 (+) Transcript_95311:75-2159(+)
MGGTKSPLPGTSLFVDWFHSAAGRGTAEYFLTHFHADHMEGLTQGWALGALHCSRITARLLAEVRRVNQRFLHVHPLDEPFEVTDPLSKSRLTVTFVDAGHCPGSIMVVLEGLPEGPIVHTGDFRYHDGLAHSNSLRRVADSGRCSCVYLDTTWAHDAFIHLPTKATSVNQLLDLIDRFPSEAVVLHSHGLGDEELLAAVACHFPHETFLFADPVRLKELHLSSPELHGLSRFTSLDSNAAADIQNNPKQRFFVVKNRRQRLKLKLQGVEISCSTFWWAKAVHSEVHDIKQPVKCRNTGAWHVLWAMHSSLAEMQSFVSWLQPRSLQPICPVICHEDSPTDLKTRFRGCLSERDKPEKLMPQLGVRPDQSQSPEGDAVDIRRRVLASAASYRAELLQARRGKSAPATPRHSAVKKADKGRGEGHDTLLGMIDGPSPGTTSSAGHQSSPPAVTSAASEVPGRASCSLQTPLVSPGLPTSMSPETLAVGSASARCQQGSPESVLLLEGTPERCQPRSSPKAVSSMQPGLTVSPNACASTQQDDSLGNSEATVLECPDTEVEDEEEETGGSNPRAAGDLLSMLWGTDSSADKGNSSCLTPTLKLSQATAVRAPKEVIVVDDGDSDVEKREVQARCPEPDKRKQSLPGNSGVHAKRRRHQGLSSALLQQSSDIIASGAPDCTVSAPDSTCIICTETLV